MLAQARKSGVNTDTLVIGAGPAGLAAAACLASKGVPTLVVERADDVGAAWRAHYRRLRLHTVKQLSALPGLPFPAQAPKYVPRDGVVAYLEAYAAHHGIRPQFGERVVEVVPADDAAGWVTTAAHGRRWRSRRVVVATGANQTPVVPEFAGRADYAGRVLHSRDYRDAAPFAGERVLVVGMGNTGAEIALDLAEHGAAAVALAVRTPVNIVRRDVLGRPTQKTSLALARLPQRWGDRAAALLRDLTVGDLRRWGLATPAVSPLAQLRLEGRTPVIDVGTLARIKAGDIAVRPGVERFTPDGVRFVDGASATFDSVVLATGYRADVQSLFPRTTLELDADGLPRTLLGGGAAQGLAFVGFDIRQPGGLLRTIALQAGEVASAFAAAA